MTKDADLLSEEELASILKPLPSAVFETILEGYKYEIVIQVRKVEPCEYEEES